MTSSRSVWRSLTSEPADVLGGADQLAAGPRPAAPRRRRWSSRRWSVSQRRDRRSRSSGAWGRRRTGATIGAKSGDDLALLVLVVGDQQQRGVDLGHGLSSFGTPPAWCAARPASRARHGAAKPERPEVARMRFSHTTDSVPSRLEVEQVVVELHAAQRQRATRRVSSAAQVRTVLGVVGHALHERHVDATPAPARAGMVPRGRSAWRRSISTSAAGNTVIIASHASRMAVPEMKPSSCMPRKSVSVST